MSVALIPTITFNFCKRMLRIALPFSESLVIGHYVESAKNKTVGNGFFNDTNTIQSALGTQRSLCDQTEGQD